MYICIKTQKKKTKLKLKNNKKCSNFHNKNSIPINFTQFNFLCDKRENIYLQIVINYFFYFNYCRFI